MRKRSICLNWSNCIESLEPRRLLTRLLGVDVSSYQGSINWTQAAASGINFAVIRASEGLNDNDADFTYNITHAAAAGLVVAPYHYAYYDLGASHTASAEAAHFWGQIKPYMVEDGLHMSPVVDVEEPLPSGWTNAQLATWVYDFATYLKTQAASIGLTITPMIYCDASFAGSLGSQTLSDDPGVKLDQVVPLWVAQWPGGTVNTQTANPSGTGGWPTWAFWQYADTGNVAGIDGGEDSDVFNGDSSMIKDYIIGSGRWAIGQALQTSASASAYVNSIGSGSATTVATGVVGSIAAGPVYGTGYELWDINFNNGVSGWVRENLLTNVPTAPSAPTYIAPANSSAVTAAPTFTWNAATGATTYKLIVNAGTSNVLTVSNLTATSYTAITLSNGSYSWYVQASNSVGTTTGATWSFTLNTPAPFASFASQTPAIGSSVFDFLIGYHSPTYSINTTTFDSHDVTVTGPGGYIASATFISQSQPGNGPLRGATYEIPAPNGSWNALANGTYTITMNANQVADTNGNHVAGGTIGTFTINDPFAYLSGNQVVINTITTNPSIYWSQSGSIWTAYNGASSIQFNQNAFTGVAFLGSSEDNSLTISSAMGVPLYYDGGSGNDSLNLSAGLLTLNADISTLTPALTLNISGTGQVNFNSNQHLAGLSLSDNATALFATGAGIAVDTQDISIEDSAYVDLADNALVIESGDPAAISTYLASGNDGGSWDGPGIDSHVAASAAGHSLGFSPASNLGYTSINGINFSSTAIVVRYTYLGDANLDATVNADDISLMMLAIAQQQSQSSEQSQSSNSSSQTSSSPVYWYNGDYNYDNQVNQDDFMLLNLGSAIQNQQVLS